MLETTVIEIAVSAVVVIFVDDVARILILTDDSSTIFAFAVNSSRTARFGWVPRKCGSALRRQEIARVSAETVDTNEVKDVYVLESVVTVVTVSTVDCVVDGTTGADCGCCTDDAVGVADNVDADASVAAEAEAAILGSASKFETVLGAKLVTAILVGVIVTFNAGYANRFETGSEVL